MHWAAGVLKHTAIGLSHRNAMVHLMGKFIPTVVAQNVTSNAGIYSVMRDINTLQENVIAQQLRSVQISDASAADRHIQASQQSGPITVTIRRQPYRVRVSIPFRPSHPARADLWQGHSRDKAWAACPWATNLSTSHTCPGTRAASRPPHRRDLRHPQPDRQNRHGMAVVCDLHRPLGDIAHVAHARALAHRQARPPYAGARAHGGGEAVGATYDFFGVGKDRVARAGSGSCRPPHSTGRARSCLRPLRR